MCVCVCVCVCVCPVWRLNQAAPIPLYSVERWSPVLFLTASNFPFHPSFVLPHFPFFPPFVLFLPTSSASVSSHTVPLSPWLLPRLPNSDPDCSVPSLLWGLPLLIHDAIKPPGQLHPAPLLHLPPSLPVGQSKQQLGCHQEYLLYVHEKNHLVGMRDVSCGALDWAERFIVTRSETDDLNSYLDSNVCSFNKPTQAPTQRVIWGIYEGFSCEGRLRAECCPLRCWTRDYC